MTQEPVKPLVLTLGHLYPDQLNLYGDRGNILTLRRRCQMRGITLRVVGLGIGDALAPDEYDMLFIGGGQDKSEKNVWRDRRLAVVRREPPRPLGRFGRQAGRCMGGIRWALCRAQANQTRSLRQDAA